MILIMYLFISHLTYIPSKIINLLIQILYYLFIIISNSMYHNARNDYPHLYYLNT